MAPRPLLRWKSFWLGVFVLGFLGWAWLSSIHAMDVALIGSPRAADCVMIGQSDGAFYVVKYRTPGSGFGHLACGVPLLGNSTSAFSFWRDHHGSPHYGIPAPAGAGGDPDGFEIWISHWLIMSLYLLVGAGWCLRRARRMRQPATL